MFKYQATFASVTSAGFARRFSAVRLSPRGSEANRLTWLLERSVSCGAALLLDVPTDVSRRMFSNWAARSLTTVGR